MDTNKMPAVIFATLNGHSTSIPGGKRHFVGGWSEDPTRGRVTTYVHADLAREAMEALEEAWEYFDNKSDADHDETGFVPNTEMTMASIVDAALAAHETRKGERHE